MSSHNHHRQRNRDKLRPARLLLGMLFFSLGACTAQTGQEVQATSRQSTENITPDAELQQRVCVIEGSTCASIPAFRKSAGSTTADTGQHSRT